MKVLVIGSGGREHALAWACAKSKLKPSITCVPGNGGTAAIAKNVNLDIADIETMVDFVREHDFDLSIIGPEAPLVEGLADHLNNYGYRVFGPTAGAARIEGSKAFAKKMMSELEIPTARFSVLTDIKAARKVISMYSLPVVVKASGLAGGKGALICNNTESALAAAEGMLLRDAFGPAGREIVIEEYLSGREMSLLAMVDGQDFMLLPTSRDHKRALDNDQGPNTGGMGAYSPVVDVTFEQVREISEKVFPPILERLCEDGTPYRGCLYAGIILTDGGPRVLEFNCRFGDPEAQAVLPLLKIDVLDLMAEVAEGGLKRYMTPKDLNSLDWSSLCAGKHAVTVVAAADGYPGTYKKGIHILSIPEETENIIPFHAGTTMKEGELFTSGGRVMAITGVGESHESAFENAYNAIREVVYEGVTFRTDIGKLSRQIGERVTRAGQNTSHN